LKKVTDRIQRRGDFRPAALPFMTITLFRLKDISCTTLVICGEKDSANKKAAKEHFQRHMNHNKPPVKPAVCYAPYKYTPNG